MAKKSKKTAVKKTKVASKTTARKTTAKTKASKPAAKKTVGKTNFKAIKKSPATAEARVLEYKLFTEDSVRNLEDQVNYHIKKGWAPVGGVVLHGQSTFTQTMVRHES